MKHGLYKDKDGKKSRLYKIWSESLGFCYHVLKNRLKRKWSVERALSTPLNK